MSLLLRTSSLVLAACACAFAAAAASIELGLDQRLGRAVDVFVGEVRSLRTEAVDGEPWTIVTLEVERWLRSAGATVDDSAIERSRRPTVDLVFLGGDAPGAPRRVVAGMPTLREGERLLLLTYGDEVRYASPIVGFDQGIFRLVDDAWTDVDGAALALGGDGILTLGERASPADDALLEALSERLAQVGARP